MLEYFETAAVDTLKKNTPQEQQNNTLNTTSHHQLLLGKVITNKMLVFFT